MEQLDRLIDTLITQHKLPAEFKHIVETWYLPLCYKIVQQHISKASTFYLGINGCQGSGKSTMAAFLESLLEQHWGLKVANLSIDDFYLTRKERKNLAEHEHPLLMTRGVPGTHDVPLAIKTLNALATDKKRIPLVRFNKAIDDRAEEADWQYIDGAADIVILEGWCIGIEAQSEAELYSPLNKLETEEDAKAKWRHFVNEQLSLQYPSLFNMLDSLVMLKAPSFECVYRWRKRQEEKLKLASKVQTYVMSDAELDRFIQHYQRLTEHAFTKLTDKADIVFHLSEEQQFIKATGL
ncbi:hypothetical protein XM47_10660 [Catenovulum maritimum]|uniref:Kinase n=2 Tax=Catenovulum maritimum TaxID=1513271 RepID=A0A0J8JKX6_9ALTE|nr:hypothetical protein XM47_10660 [Catenovulum maritimum]